MIHSLGCCNVWNPDPVRGDKPDEYFKGGDAPATPNRVPVKRGPSAPADIERSRGIADITMSAEGKADVDKLGQDMAKRGRVDIIFTSPLWRCMQTAKAIQKYSPSAKIFIRDELMTWGYGGQEGKPASETESRLMRFAKNKSDQPVPGTGPVSGARGEPFAKWKAQILIQGFVPIIRYIKAYPDKVVVIVCHSRDIYTLEGWISAGMPKSLAIDFKEMESGDHPPGDVSTLTYKPSGVWDTRWVDLRDAEEDLGKGRQEGLVVRHGKTHWN